LEIKDVKALKALFMDVKVNPYWENHYRFDQESAPSAKQMGEASVNILLLNTLALFLFSYGKDNGLQYFISRGLALLESLPQEDNKIVEDFSTLGVKIKNAFESQALLELKNNYCNYKKCLQCGIGNKLLRYA